MEKPVKRENAFEETFQKLYEEIRYQGHIVSEILETREKNYLEDKADKELS